MPITFRSYKQAGAKKPKFSVNDKFFLIQNQLQIFPNAQLDCNCCYAFGFLFIPIFTFQFSVSLLHRLSRKLF
ncbi:hypothetical protein DMB65_21275 [Flavobacterium cheongpyeongense]|uniref:Uncharacterized protein n=1 Tax=Flavobacterium cheongpyeongense TaxID=2212651 RepID=A0A2V4BIF0_9FLAO|nr:hypothetical protein DMB65_21275 [Flavobacterium cheongpyeongense]